MKIDKAGIPFIAGALVPAAREGEVVVSSPPAADP